MGAPAGWQGARRARPDHALRAPRPHRAPRPSGPGPDGLVSDRVVARHQGRRRKEVGGAMRAFTLAAVLSAAWATTGCIGPSCQSTCNKIFGEPPDQCGLQVPGKELEESFKDCRDECEFA